MSKNIVDGKLVEVSPSMISTFDEKDAFGCERRGFYKYVMGLKEPVTGNQQLGTDLHALVAQRLRSGTTPEGEGEAFGLYLSGQQMIEEVAKRTIVAIEEPLTSFKIADVKVKGFIDVVTSDGIIDWKTTSNINRYGKKEKDLKTDTQMVIYAQASHPALSNVKLAHGQFQTKGRGVAFVETEVTREMLDSHTDKVIVPLVERIKVVAGFTDAKEAKPVNNQKCFRCAFRDRCKDKESENVMSFFSKFTKVVPTTPEDTLNALKASIDIVNGIIPPDAAKSDPALAADPVDGFTSAITAPEPRTLVLAPPPPVEAPIAEQVEAPAPKKRGRPKKEATPGVVFKSVTITKGCTINVGNFNSVRFDVSMTAEGADVDATYAEVLAEVERRLDEEASKFQAETSKGVTANAKELVSK